jgi:hypothetical protein
MGDHPPSGSMNTGYTSVVGMNRYQGGPVFQTSPTSLHADMTEIMEPAYGYGEMPVKSESQGSKRKRASMPEPDAHVQHLSEDDGSNKGKGKRGSMGHTGTTGLTSCEACRKGK